VADGRRAIEFADRSGDAKWPCLASCTAADALHQAGERDKARASFAEAERMQAEMQPEFPLLYSVAGFRYADLLLAPAERAAWQGVLAGRGSVLECGSPLPLSASGSEGAPEVSATPESARGLAQSKTLRDAEDALSDPLAACAEAERRARQTLEWGTTYGLGLLDIALDHLTQARAALYRALLTHDDSQSAIPPNPQSAIEAALAKLRAANDLGYFPQALLTAAFYHGTLGGDPAEAARLLDEAQQIAERGPMPLYLADVHLHRARLVSNQSSVARGPSGAGHGAFTGIDPKAELAKARALIEQHKYGRRKEELADTEAALR
jgi:tetratricopeptide (TPR) repeat protein